jgi:hypothetical protein
LRMSGWSSCPLTTFDLAIAPRSGDDAGKHGAKSSERRSYMTHDYRRTRSRGFPMVGSRWRGRQESEKSSGPMAPASSRRRRQNRPAGPA